MSKPSERIEEIATQLNKNPQANDLELVINELQAILNYLDKEWEKQKLQNTICGMCHELGCNGKRHVQVGN